MKSCPVCGAALVGPSPLDALALWVPEAEAAHEFGTALVPASQESTGCIDVSGPTGTSGCDAADLLWLLASVAVPVRARASGWLNQMGGVGPRAIPVAIGRRYRDAIANGDDVPCWITNEMIRPGHLDMDHVIPWSFGGASNAANLLPADSSANRSRGCSLDILVERKIGWKWDTDSLGRPVRIPDFSQRLVRVSAREGEALYFSVPRFNRRDLGTGIRASVLFTVATEAATQVVSGEFRPGDLSEQALRAATAYSVRYATVVGVKNIAPHVALRVGGDAALAQKLTNTLAEPLAVVFSIVGAEFAGQGFNYMRTGFARKKAEKRVALSRALAAAKAGPPSGETQTAGRGNREGYKRLDPIDIVSDLNRAAPVMLAISTTNNGSYDPLTQLASFVTTLGLASATRLRRSSRQRP